MRRSIVDGLCPGGRPSLSCHTLPACTHAHAEPLSTRLFPPQQQPTWPASPSSLLNSLVGGQARWPPQGAQHPQQQPHPFATQQVHSILNTHNGWFALPSRASITSREGTLLPGPAGSGAPDLSNERQQRGIRCRGTALPWARSIFRLLNRTCAGASISRAVRTSALSAFVAVAALPLFWLVRNSPYVSAAILQTMLERSASQCVPSSLDRHFLMPSLASVTRASRWCPLP